MRTVRERPVASFFVLAYALAWAWWVPLALADRGWFALPWRTHLPGLAAPLVAAVAVTWAADGSRGLRALARRMVRWRIGARWALVAIGPLLAVVGVAVAAAPFGGGPTVAEMGRFDEIGDVGVIPLLLVLVVLNGLGEETGWRGVAHDRLNASGDPRRSIGIVAALWAGWHVPLFFFHDGFQEIPAAVLPGWFIGLGAGTVVLAWLYERTGRSILAVAVWHGTYNWAAASDAGGEAIGVAVTAVVIVAALVLTRRGDFERRDDTGEVAGHDGASPGGVRRVRRAPGRARAR